MRMFVTSIAVLGLLSVPSARAATDAVHTASSAEAVPSVPAQKIPVSMIIDDGAFYVQNTPNSFLKRLGEWAITNGVKGKFSVVPIFGGKAAIDGSLGEYGGTTREERLEWIEMVRTLIAPRWTITPEIITHGKPWDLVNRVCMTNMPKENLWLAEQSLETQTEYIAAAMQLLKNVDIELGGLTMCWSYPAQKNHILGEATLRAAERVQGLTFVILFNDPGEQPAVIYKREDGAMAVSMRPALSDRLDYADTFTPADMQRIANLFITADGTSGLFVDQIKKGVCLEFFTHYNNLYSKGTYKGLDILTIAIQRLNKFYGNQIEWMTGMEICRHFAQ